VLKNGTQSPKDAKQWKLHSVVTVFRHADRTPKMKLKYAFKDNEEWARPLFDLLQGRRDEIILRQAEQLHYVSEAADKAMNEPGADKVKLASLKRILEKKIPFAGTKTQLKPTFDSQGHCEKIQVIVKWGGEFTHAARYQSKDVAENMRKDLTIMNKYVLRR
jgi:inositol hexakisphosphate/diphosphoinositol-pentakisphosphate kinase